MNWVTYCAAFAAFWSGFFLAAALAAGANADRQDDEEEAERLEQISRKI